MDFLIAVGELVYLNIAGLLAIGCVYTIVKLAKHIPPKK